MLFTGKILICRPKAQADKLAQVLSNRGWQPIIFPTVEIQPIDLTQKFIPLSKNRIQQADVILIQSPSVLTYLDQPSVTLLKQSKVIYAMGAGTQEALLAQNIDSCWVASQGAASEQILNQPPITDLPVGSHIILLTGEGGRAVLEPELNKKGLICQRINTYKRAMPTYSQQQINNILLRAPEVILVTSVDILKNLLTIFKGHSHNIKNFPLLVISPRIQYVAQALGWQGEILLADSASSEAIIMALKRHDSIK